MHASEIFQILFKLIIKTCEIREKTKLTNTPTTIIRILTVLKIFVHFVKGIN